MQVNGDRDLQRERHALLAQLVQADQRLAALQTELVKEQEDVANVRRSMHGPLKQLAKVELDIQLRQAAEVGARLQAELAARGDLQKQLVVLDRAIANDPIQIAREAAAKKAVAHLDALAQRSRAEQILELDARIEAIDIELQPLTSALRAGNDAVKALTAALQRVAATTRDGARLGRTEKALLDEALSKALEFYAALGDLPPFDDVSPRLADVIEAGDRAPYERDLPARLERLGELGARVIERHVEVAQRRLAFETQRSRLRS